MGEQRQRYNEKFKRETVKYIQNQTKTVVEIGEELGISPGVLHNWLGKYREFSDESVNSAEKVRELEQRLKEQEKELRVRAQRIADVEEELAIIKKRCTSSANQRTEISVHQNPSLRVSSGEDVPCFQCFPERILQMESGVCQRSSGA